MEGANYIFKILVVGKSGSGKTALVRKFVDDRIVRKYVPTMGLDLHSKILTIGDDRINLSIWDTGGGNEYDRLINFYYKGTLAAIITIDPEDSEPQNTIDHWILEIEKYCSHVPIAIVFTKISTEEFQIADGVNEITKKWKQHWREPILTYHINYNKGEIINEIFNKLTAKILKDVKYDERFDEEVYV